MPTITIGGRAGNTFSGMQDVVLFASFPTNNYSTETASQNEAFLLRPDLSGIPGGATITDAFWTFGINSGAGSTAALAPRRVLRAWVEAQASYNNYATATAWGTAGCLADGTDRIAGASCTLSYPGGFSTADIASTSNTQLIADIQAIVAGSAVNNGWRFDGGVSVGLPGHGTAATRPFLTVTYTAGTNQDLAGAAAGQASATGAAAVAKPLAGGASGQSTAAGGVAVGKPLAGGAGGQAAASGELLGGATITTVPLKNDSGTLLTALTIEKLAALRVSDMAQAASWANQATNGAGVLSLFGAGLVAGTAYLLVSCNADGSARGIGRYTAT